MAILHNFIDEWFNNPNLSFDDLQLLIGISVAFQRAIAPELALAQRIVELKNKMTMRKTSSRSMWPSLVWLTFKTSR